jgi:uncharacterized radical SAM protein YgiQ
MFLPATKKEMLKRGWDYVDIVLVTGDAYVDHPSFGVALIGRWLEKHGYRVAVLAQPKHGDKSDFTRFGKPRLFFGITAGNLDSIVSNYTGNGKVRDTDQYSPGGNPYFDGREHKSNRRRPDRATILYTSLAKAAYKNVPVVLGGLEASLRRFIHYDYQQARLRSSILVDAKADILVYGMGERAVLEIANRLSRGKKLAGIPGTCERLTARQMDTLNKDIPTQTLPSWTNINTNSSLFLDAELEIDTVSRRLADTHLVQQQKSAWIIQHPPAQPLTGRELDALYELPFTRRAHPSAGDVPAYRMIKDSVTIVRGCYGNCSFCAITRHQGPLITSRSRKSIIREIKRIAREPDFSGTISDLGGPTANMFATSCNNKKCRKHDCLYPEVCRNLIQDEKEFLQLLEDINTIKQVKHTYISSGLRMEMLLRTPKLLKKIILDHLPGSIKIAPEHTDAKVLKLMHKENPRVLRKFIDTCRIIARDNDTKVHFTPYFISAHPGCTVNDMKNLAASIKKLGLDVRLFQDFTPTPGTISTAMYVTGLDRSRKKPIPVARKSSERMAQRKVLEKIRK